MSLKRTLSRLVVLVVMYSVTTVHLTNGLLTDSVTSNDNTVTAATLAIALQNSSGGALSTPLFSVSNLKPGDPAVSKTFRVNNAGLLTPEYQPVIAFSGSLTLCDKLTANVTRDGGGTPVYSGPLSELVVPSVLMSGESDSWNISLDLTDDSSDLQNQTCAFSLIVNAWQPELSYSTGFHDQVSNTSNTVASGTWTVAPKSGDVVINEVMWATAAGDGNDEWLELRNATDRDIDLAGWTIDNAASGKKAITIPSGIIKAGKFFLVSRYAVNESAINNSTPIQDIDKKLSLNDNGEQLVLKTPDDTTIDSTTSGKWPAGDHKGGKAWSMERNDVPGDGTVGGNWHTCTDEVCNDGLYWDDADGNSYGTPGYPNKSSNDPSSADSVVKPSVKEESNVDGGSAGNSGTGNSGTDQEPTATPTPTPLPSPSPTPEITASPTPEPTQSPVVDSNNDSSVQQHDAVVQGNAASEDPAPVDNIDSSSDAPV